MEINTLLLMLFVTGLYDIFMFILLKKCYHTFWFCYISLMNNWPSSDPCFVPVRSHSFCPRCWFNPMMRCRQSSGPNKKIKLLGRDGTPRRECHQPGMVVLSVFPNGYFCGANVFFQIPSAKYRDPTSQRSTVL